MLRLNGQTGPDRVSCVQNLEPPTSFPTIELSSISRGIDTESSHKSSTPLFAWSTYGSSERMRNTTRSTREEYEAHHD